MRYIFFICACWMAVQVRAQSPAFRNDTSATKQQLTTINQALDQAVVAKDVAVLQKHYAPDFYFLHGTGKIDSKKSWIAFVLDTATHYGSRRHDSVFVELHGDVALLTGILTVRRPAGATEAGYALRYIRVYGYRNKVWQLLSHHTTQEWHLGK